VPWASSALALAVFNALSRLYARYCASSWRYCCSSIFPASFAKAISGSSSWAERLKRVFDIDISVCPLCGGTLRVIADVTDPEAIRTILAHLRQRAPPDAGRRQRPGQGPQNDLFAAS